MDCPRTGQPMEEVEINGVKVDISTGCGGIWFDNFELEKFDEKNESAGEKLIAASKKYLDTNVDTSARLQSPKNPDVTMMRHFFSVREKIEIDECPETGGIWLDPGELKKIRDLFTSEEAKNEAADEYFRELFNSPEMKAIKEKSDEDLRKAKRFAHMFRFLCPSYYVPGEQDWGAY